MQGKDEALEAVHAAVAAYDYGRGTWPRLTANERIQYVQKYLNELKVHLNKAFQAKSIEKT